MRAVKGVVISRTQVRVLTRTPSGSRRTSNASYGVRFQTDESGVRPALPHLPDRAQRMFDASSKRAFEFHHCGDFVRGGGYQGRHK